MRRPTIHASFVASSNPRLVIAVAAAALLVTTALGIVAPVSAPVAILLLLLLALLAAMSTIGVLAAMVVTLPYFYRPIGIGSSEFAASELLLFACVAGAAGRVFADLVRRRIDFSDLRAVVMRALRSRLVMFLLVITLCGIVTLAFAYDPSARSASLREWRWTLFEPLVFLVLLTVFGPTPTSRYLLAGSLVAAGVVAATHGLFDVVSGGGVAADNVTRLDGPFPHPNALALFTLRPFVFVTAILVLAPQWRRYALIPALLTGAALFGTFSRGAMVAVAVIALLLSVGAPRRVRAAIGVAGATLVALAVVIAGDRMTNALEGGSVSLRLDIWQSASAMIRDRPVLGYGPDQFFYAYAPRYIQPTAWDERFTSHAHNLIADSWIRLGIVGAIAALVALVFVAKRVLSSRNGINRRTALKSAALVALAATFVHGLIDNAYFAHDLAMSGWLLAWLALDDNLDGGRIEDA